MRIPLRRTSAFTLVEMLVGITIFSIGLVGVAMLFQSAIHASLYSRHEIVAGNLLREQIELVKNLRDSNWRSFRDWNKAFVTNQLGGEEEKNLSPGIFLIENNGGVKQVDYGGKKSPVRITTGLPPLPSKLTDVFSDLQYRKYRLCIDSENGYTHDCSTGKAPTEYASYFEIKPLEYDQGKTVGSGYILVAHVLVGNSMKVQDYDMKTVITDWKR